MCCYLTALNVCQSSSFLLRCFFFYLGDCTCECRERIEYCRNSFIVTGYWKYMVLSRYRQTPVFFCWYACIIHWRAYFLLCAVMLSFISIFPTEYEYIDETQNRFFRVPLFKMLWVIVLYCTEQALIICGRNDGNSHIRCTQSLLWY